MINNMVIVQPLLFFFFILGILISPETLSGGASIAGLIMIISVIGLFCAFLAGWYSMFHKSIEYVDKFNLPPEEKAINSLGLFKEFFPGVGKYFPKIVFGMIIYGLLSIILLIIIEIIGDAVIGFPESISADHLMKALSSNEESIKFLNKISPADKIKIFQWDLLGLIAIGLFSYLTMFWVQAVISNDKYPAKAYWDSIKTVFKNPIATMVIHSSQWVSIVGICIVSSAYSMNIIVQFFMLMILILVVVYFTLMSFLYYERFR
jgi:hypothetical protein